MDEQMVTTRRREQMDDQMEATRRREHLHKALSTYNYYKGGGSNSGKAPATVFVVPLITVAIFLLSELKGKSSPTTALDRDSA